MPSWASTPRATPTPTPRSYTGHRSGFSPRPSVGEGSKTTGPPLLGVHAADRLDRDVLEGDGLVSAPVAGLHARDLIDHVHAGDHLADNRVAYPVVGLGPVEEGVVLEV